MDLRVAKLIVKTAEDEGLDGVSLHENYSGRGMYGKTTAGIVCDSDGDLLAAVASAVWNFAGACGDPDEGGLDENDLSIDTIVLALRRTSQDSMGRSRIIY